MRIAASSSPILRLPAPLAPVTTQVPRAIPPRLIRPVAERFPADGDRTCLGSRQSTTRSGLPRAGRFFFFRALGGRQRTCRSGFPSWHDTPHREIATRRGCDFLTWDTIPIVSFPRKATRSESYPTLNHILGASHHIAASGTGRSP